MKAYYFENIKALNKFLAVAANADSVVEIKWQPILISVESKKGGEKQFEIADRYVVFVHEETK